MGILHFPSNYIALVVDYVEIREGKPPDYVKKVSINIKILASVGPYYDNIVEARELRTWASNLTFIIVHGVNFIGS